MKNIIFIGMPGAGKTTIGKEVARTLAWPFFDSDVRLRERIHRDIKRYSMVTPEAKATLNDIATEELGHAEIMGTIVRQLMQGLTKDQIIEGGLEAYYVNHGFGVYPCSAAGVPFSAAAFQSKGDPITDLYEDMAAEQKARSTYEYLIDLAEDPDVLAPLRFLREREVVHFQRFGEANQSR